MRAVQRWVPALGRMISARTWHDQARCGRVLVVTVAVVDLRAVVNVEDVDTAAVLVDPVDDAIGAAQGAVTIVSVYVWWPFTRGHCR